MGQSKLLVSESNSLILFVAVDPQSYSSPEDAQFTKLSGENTLGLFPLQFSNIFDPCVDATELLRPLFLSKNTVLINKQL